MTHHPVPPWSEVATDLINVATGRKAADTVIRGGAWVNVHTREVLDGYDIAIIKGRIGCVVPDATHSCGPETRIIRAEGRYMVPGLCDGHMHIESGMLTPAEFARAVIPHGTT
jgi:adenine deaminase